MRKLFVILCLFSGLFLTPVLSRAHPDPKGHTHITASETKTFINTDCEETKTCDLKGFSLYIQRYEVWISGDSEPVYGTSIIAEYETDSMGALENYVFVQFVRGCAFESEKLTDGNWRKLFDRKTPQFGEDKWTSHQDWDIDSEDNDPVYYSRNLKPRHYYYMWGNFKNSNELKDVRIYGEEKPEEPKLYVYDSPFGAFLMGDIAQNVSYEFRMCIYKTVDVPTLTTQNNVDFASPIGCLNWSSSYIYNAATGEFETKDEIDPFCKEKPPPY